MIKLNIIINSLCVLLIIFSLIPSQIGFGLSNNIVIGVVVCYFFSILQGLYLCNTLPKKGQFITSRISVLYKVYFPILTLVSFAYCNILLIFKLYSPSSLDLVIMIESMMVIWGLGAIGFMKLKLLAFQDGDVVVCDIFKRHLGLKKCKIVKISRFLLFCRKVELLHNGQIQKVLLLPPITRKSTLLSV